MSNKPTGNATVHTSGPKFSAAPPVAEPVKAEPVTTAPAVADKPADAPAKESKPRKYIGKVGSLSEDVATFVTETQDRLAELVGRVWEINEKSAPEPGEERAATHLARVVMTSEDLTRALQGVQATNNDLSAAVASV